MGLPCFRDNKPDPKDEDINLDIVEADINRYKPKQYNLDTMELNLLDNDEFIFRGGLPWRRRE